MEEEILVVEENTQIINKIDVIETVSFYKRNDFDLSGENSVSILTKLVE
jgi:hypothetical protein